MVRLNAQRFTPDVATPILTPIAIYESDSVTTPESVNVSSPVVVVSTDDSRLRCSKTTRKGGCKNYVKSNGMCHIHLRQASITREVLDDSGEQPDDHSLMPQSTDSNDEVLDSSEQSNDRSLMPQSTDSKCDISLDDEVSELIKSMTPREMAEKILQLELRDALSRIATLESEMTHNLQRMTKIVQSVLIGDEHSLAEKTQRCIKIQDKIAKLNFTIPTDLDELTEKAWRYSSALGLSFDR
jgi:hypothetical protein